MTSHSSTVKRAVIFYDGSYFAKISHYYKHTAKRGRINFAAFHELLRYRLAKLMGVGKELIAIVEVHWYRGRLPAEEVKKRNLLEDERRFDDALMRSNIITHYYPNVQLSQSNEWQEKGIDVWLSLDAFDLAVHKKYDILILITGDQDYVPLIRKLHSIGTLTFVVGEEQPGVIGFSRVLAEEATFSAIIAHLFSRIPAEGSPKDSPDADEPHLIDIGKKLFIT